MHDEIIDTDDRVIWAVDRGESGYVLLYNGENGVNADKANPDQTVWDYMIFTDQGILLGTSCSQASDQAHGPIFTLDSKIATDALVSMLDFLSDDADRYRVHMGPVPSSHDPYLFGEEVAAWAYLNDSVLSVTAVEFREGL